MKHNKMDSYVDSFDSVQLDQVRDHSWPHDIAAGLVCILVVIAALTIGQFREIANLGVETDFYGSYAPQAERLMQGQPYTYRHNPPGYVLLLTLMSLLTDNLFRAGTILTALAAGLLGWVAYLLFKALFDPRVAVAATVLLLLTLVPHSFLAATDVVGALAMTLPVLILVKPSTVTLRICILAGIAAGAAYLIRSNAISVILGIGFCLLFVYPNQQRVQTRLLKAGGFLIAALLVIAPWFLYNWRMNGSPFASTAYLQVAAYHHFGEQLGTTLRLAEAEFDSFGEVIARDPSGFFGTYFKDILVANPLRLARQVLGFPEFLFAACGLVLFVANLCRRKAVLLVVAGFGYLIVGLVGFLPRYYLFLYPVLFFLVAYALFQPRIFSFLGRVPYFKFPVAVAVLAALGIGVAVKSSLATKKILDSEPKHLLGIAEFLRERSSPGEVIIVRKPHLAYLSSLKQAFPLVKSADDYLSSARRIGARYIVYSEPDVRLWPGLDSLKDPGSLPNGFKVIYRHEKPRVLVYEINAGSEHGG
jgi:hypothetical protein